MQAVFLGVVLVGVVAVGASGAVVAGQPAETDALATTNGSDLPTEISREIEGEGTRMAFDLDLSLLQSPLAAGSAVRFIGGGFANGQRVIWVDVGVVRTESGLETRSQMRMNLPI